MSPASRIESAISFGVFCRRAPSTIAIMRSRKVSPGLAVTRTTSQSESTRVPPVTELKSPPASRITGADSPVIALSSTEATPSITSPSAGMKSPASTSTTSPRRSVEPADLGPVARPGAARRASSPSPRAARCAGVAACAFARPSATASAKFANSTVNHSHTVTCRMNPGGGLAFAEQGLDEQDRREDGADVHDEHDRVAHLRARRELAERVGERLPQRLAAEELSRVSVSVLVVMVSCCLLVRRVQHAGARRSARARARARKSARRRAAPSRRAAPRTAACGSAACRARRARVFFAASDPAIASTGTSSQ